MPFDTLRSPPSSEDHSDRADFVRGSIRAKFGICAEQLGTGSKCRTKSRRRSTADAHAPAFSSKAIRRGFGGAVRSPTRSSAIDHAGGRSG